MPTKRQLIQKITLNASTASVSFANIPQNYTDLRVVVSARTSRAAATDALDLKFNSSASGYSWRRLNGSGTSVTTDTGTSTTVAVINGDTSSSNTFGSVEIFVPQYSSSNQKAFQTFGAQETNATATDLALRYHLWSNTSSIVTIELFSGNSANFLANSTFYLYGIAAAPIINGGEVSIRDGFKYHTFRSTSTLQVVEPGDVEYLVVAGGGAASNGARFAGGGGAGGLLNGRLRLAPGAVTVTVGSGGPVSATVAACKGSDSTLSSITATGGGGGSAETLTPGTGGSGGGGQGGLTGQAGAAGTSGQGNSGGSGGTTYRTAGGGGGAGGVGGNGAQNGGNGGSGLTVWGYTYAGGGGGSAYDNTDATGSPGTGGSGGGGTGGRYRTTNGTPSFSATAGQANTGGGGGGGAWGGANGSDSAAGGSGIVIIRYPYTGN